MKHSFQKIMLIVFLGLIVNSFAEVESTYETDENPSLNLNKVENFFAEFSELPHDHKEKMKLRKSTSLIENPNPEDPVLSAVFRHNSESKKSEEVVKPLNKDNKLVEKKSPIKENIVEKSNNVQNQSQNKVQEQRVAENKVNSSTNVEKVVEANKNLKVEKAIPKQEQQEIKPNKSSIVAPPETRKKLNQIKIDAKVQAKPKQESEGNNETVLSFETDSNEKNEIKNANRKANTVLKIDALDDDVSKLKKLVLEPVIYVKELTDTGAANLRDDR